MGIAEFDDVVPFANQPEVAAAIISRDPNNNLLHTGIYFKTAENRVCILHLGWENSVLTAGHWRQGRRLWAAPPVAQERLDGIAARCELILDGFRESRTFPYGFGYPDAEIDRTTGRCVSGEGARGLTCSTFVLAVFKTQGILLIDEANWPTRKRADLRFVRFVRRIVARGPSPKIHLRIVRRLERGVQKGRIRFRPEEIIAAMRFTMPATFDDVYDEAFKIRSLLPKK